MIAPMNLGMVLVAWNLARQQAGLSTLTYSVGLSRYAAQYLAPWRPGLDPEAPVSRYPAVLVQMAPAAGWTPQAVAQGLLGSPYHRAVILDPHVTQVGIVEDCQGTSCVVLAEFGGPAPKAEAPAFILWVPPLVPSAWQDYEYPNPFPALAEGATAGYPLSVRATALDGTVSGAEIVGPGGRIPCWVNETQTDSNALVIAPRSPLAPGRYVLRFWWCGVGRARVVQRVFSVAS